MHQSAQRPFGLGCPSAIGLFSSFLVAILVPWVARPLVAQQVNVPASSGYEAIADRLSGLIREQINDKSIPAFSIALVDDQRIVWAEGFGYQDAQRTRPATAQTVYRVGSISKLFTDIAIMQLVEQGAVDLDSAVQKYLPSFRPDNPYDVPITLRQLMSHRAGLVRESPVGNYFDPSEPSLQQTVASLNTTRLVYRPESRTKYSNAGVAVVGLVLEQLAGQSFERAIEQRLLVPLGMAHSGYTLNDQRQSLLADAVMWTHDGRTFPAAKFQLGTSPAGNLYSTVLDLSRLLSAVFADGATSEHRILSAEMMQSMVQPQFASNESLNTFGIGFHLSRFQGQRLIGHGGAVYGFSTELSALPERKLGVVAVAAKDGANGLVSRITHYALEMMLAQQASQALPDHPRTGPISPQRARQLDGRYAAASSAAIDLIERNERLFMQQGSFRLELKAQQDRLIVDDVLGFGTTVQTPRPEALMIDQVEYQRVGSARPEPMPARWAGLVGEYGWDHNTLFVYEDRGTLSCLIEWFYHYPLTEIDKNTFAFPDYGLYHGERLHFDRDDSGRATQVNAAEVVFRRREVGTRDGQTFRITPAQPIDQIRRVALEARPPEEEGNFRRPELVELVTLDDSIKLDIRYATTNNFMGSQFYQQPRAFMQRPAAEAVVRAHRRLKQHGFGLLIHDAYRPWYVTKMFWEATPGDMKIFVANPQNGSRHNRGCAVDLTLYDLKTGEVLFMGAGYDEFSPRSFPDYPVESSRSRWQRELLRDAMEAEGFAIYEFEWWHFDFQDWKEYPIMNVRFEEIE